MSTPTATKIFEWQGLTKTGQKVNGEQAAINIFYAKALLRTQGITPVKVRLKRTLLFTHREKKIKAVDIAFFTRQLATLLAAGIPMVQALELIATSQSNTTLEGVIIHIKTAVESGCTLTDALRKYPQYFNALYCNLIATGEQSGALENILHRIASYKEKTEILKSNIKKALLYPSAVLSVAMIVTTILLIFVVPQFETLFNGFGSHLPTFTLGVIALSKALQKYGLLAFIILLCTVTFTKIAIRKSMRIAKCFDKFLLQIPIIGHILENAIIARFTRTLAITFAAGIPLVDALRSVASASGNLVYYEAALRMRDDISAGQSFYAAMKSTQLFPNRVSQMIKIGEESGSLDTMLHKISDFYEQQVDTAVDGLSGLLEPLIMVTLGLLIGGLVIAMYLPIFKLGSVF